MRRSAAVTRFPPAHALITPRMWCGLASRVRAYAARRGYRGVSESGRTVRHSYSDCYSLWEL